MTAPTNKQCISPLNLKPRNKRERRRLQDIVGSFYTLKSLDFSSVFPGEPSPLVVVTEIQFQLVYSTMWQQTQYRMVVTILNPRTNVLKDLTLSDGGLSGSTRRPTIDRFIGIFNRHFTTAPNRDVFA